MRRQLGIALVIAGTLSAQRVWIVDAENGPGTDFKELRDAVAAAGPADTIRVRPGQYLGVDTSKPARILGSAGVRVKWVSVADLPRGTSFALRSVQLELLRMRRCSGQVLLDRVTSKDTYFIGCAAVSFTGCTLRDGVRVEESSANFNDCQMLGRHGYNYRSWRGLEAIGGGNALTTRLSTVILAGVRAVGGDSNPDEGARYAPPAAAIYAIASRTVVAGDAQSRFAAGRPLWYAKPGAPALLGYEGALLLGSSVSLVPSGNASPHAGFTEFHSRRLPALTARSAGLGERLEAELYSEPGHVAVLLLGAPVTPSVLPIGQAWIDVPTSLVVDAGVQGPGQRRRVAIPIPRDPALRGVAVILQALSGAVERLELSTPALAIVGG